MTNFAFSIPPINQGGTPVTFMLKTGQSAFVLGANGSGKSSMMHLFYQSYSNASLRISAHRQTWFASDSLQLSPESKRQSEANIKNRDTGLDARWKDDLAAVRANIAIYELIDAENVRAREIACAVDRDDIDTAKRLATRDAPIAIINELLELCGLPISISVHHNERVLAQKRGSEKYSVAELSDGERNALLIAAAVLTAKPDSLILIDEPERHLHRSIISPLLTHLFARRDDCAFLISTHEMLLPIDNNEAITLLVRSCKYENKSPIGWDINIVSDPHDIPEEIKFDIYGARNKVLFVEGTEESLDKPLYGILFPDISIIPKNNCREVERATNGIRASENLHWVAAYGLIDSDGRENEIDTLTENGICAIQCYSVESLYYHPGMIRMISKRVSKVDGSDPKKRFDNALSSALEVVRPHRDRLCERIATRKIHELAYSKTPNANDVALGNDVTIHLPVTELLEKEYEQFDDIISANNYLKLVQRYPLRETPALKKISEQLGFRTRKDYEAAVLKACSDDGYIRNTVIRWLGNLNQMLR